MTGAGLPRVGILGFGRMARAITERLVERGLVPLIWNRTPGRTAGIVGLREASSPADLAKQCDVILVIVRDEAAMRHVYGGTFGLAAADLHGKFVVEMSTAAISAVLAALSLAASAGAEVVDAPLSGSVIPARQGELMVMAGGDASAVEKLRPVLDLFARRVVHVGPLGAGITMKLVLNVPLASYWQLLGEALGLGVRHGLALDEMLSVIADSKASVGALPGKIDRILDPSLPPEFDLAGMHKDLIAMCDSAEAVGHAMPSCSAAMHSAGRAVSAGWGERDLAQLVRFAAAEPEPSGVLP